MIKKKVFYLFILSILFLACLDFYKKNRQIFFLDHGEKYPYNIFYNELSEEIDIYLNKDVHFNRDVNINKYNQLEDRKKLRWVFNKFHVNAKILIKNVSDNQKFVSKEKLSLYLYSSFIGIFFFLIFLFLLLILESLKKNSTNNINISSLQILFFLIPVYLFIIIYLFFYHFRGNYSIYGIFETLFVVMGFYFALKKNYFMFALISIFAPMIRISAIFISFFFLLLNFSSNLKNNLIYCLFPILSVFTFLALNFDLISFFLTDGFLVTNDKIQGQVTYHMFESNFLTAFQALFYNYILFFIPLIFFYQRKNKSQIYLLALILPYILILLVGTALEDITNKFMPASLMIIYIFLNIYKIPKLSH
jgi:hypothetical protein